MPSGCTCTFAPAMSSRTVTSASATSVITASVRESSGCADRQECLLRGSVAVERRRPRFDGADAGPFHLRGPRRLGVDGGLDVFPTEFVLGRLGAVDAEAVLGEQAAVGGDQSALTRVACQPFGHRGDRMRDVVVPRTAGEGEAAGHGQRPAPVIERQLQFGGGDLNRRREAGVDVDQVDVVDADVGQFEDSPTGDPDRRGPVQLRAFTDRVRVMRIRTRIRENPTLGGDLQMGGLLGGGQDDDSALIDHVVRVHQLGVGPADHPVSIARPPDLLGRQRCPDPGIRVGLCHIAESATTIRRYACDGRPATPPHRFAAPARTADRHARAAVKFDAVLGRADHRHASRWRPPRTAPTRPHWSSSAWCRGRAIVFGCGRFRRRQ